MPHWSYFIELKDNENPLFVHRQFYCTIFKGRRKYISETFFCFFSMGNTTHSILWSRPTPSKEGNRNNHLNASKRLQWNPTDSNLRSEFPEMKLIPEYLWSAIKLRRSASCFTQNFTLWFLKREKVLKIEKKNKTKQKIF